MLDVNPFFCFFYNSRLADKILTSYRELKNHLSFVFFHVFINVRLTLKHLSLFGNLKGFYTCVCVGFFFHVPILMLHMTEKMFTFRSFKFKRLFTCVYFHYMPFPSWHIKKHPSHIDVIKMAFYLYVCFFVFFLLLILDFRVKYLPHSRFSKCFLLF